MPDVSLDRHPGVVARVPRGALLWPVCGALALVAAWLGRPDLAAAAIVLLLLGWLPSLWRRQRALAWLGWLAAVAAVVVPTLSGHAAWVLAALPVVVPAALAWTFGKTLRPGVEPLIRRFVRMTEGEARAALPRVRRYTRGVTVFWTALLTGMALLSLTILLLAAPGGWLVAAGVATPLRLPGSLLAWYPQVGGWSLLLAALAGEYLFRRWYLRAIPHASFGRFIAGLVRGWPALLRGGNGPA